MPEKGAVTQPRRRLEASRVTVDISYCHVAGKGWKILEHFTVLHFQQSET